MVAEITKVAVNPKPTLTLIYQALNLVETPLPDHYLDFLVPCIDRLEDADENDILPAFSYEELRSLETMLDTAARMLTMELMVLRSSSSAFMGSPADYQRLRAESPAEYAKLTTDKHEHRKKRIVAFLQGVDNYNCQPRMNWGQ